MEPARPNLVSPLQRLWQRFGDFLDRRAEDHVNAWAMAVQYKRRYTNPEEAKALRTPLEDIKLARVDISRLR